MRFRQKRNLSKIKKQKQEYPTLARKIIEISDIILQVLDARFIEETRNIELEKIIRERNKRLINVINKSDLVKNKSLSKELSSELYPYSFVSCSKRTGIKKLRDMIKIEAKKIESTASKIIREGYVRNVDEDKIKVGVIGYPNTGKSSLINILVGKSVAGTGAEAGFTKGIQKLRLGPEITLLDTPGIIPNAVYTQVKETELAKHAKLGGKSYSQVKDPESVVAELMKKYSKPIGHFYSLDTDGNSEFLIEELGKKRNFFQKGGEVDTDKTARLILKDWQEGKIKL